MATALKEGRYIYCITESHQSQSFGPLGIGGRGDQLYTICFNDIAAVVSNAPVKQYHVSRENTITHEKAIEEVMKEHTVLPVRFATIAEDEQRVKEILEREYGRFMELLHKMHGMRELGLKAMFKGEVIFKDILENYEDIKELKERIATLPPDRTYYQRMEIGKVVAAALRKEKEVHKETVLHMLSPLAVEVKANRTFGDMMIVNAAFLVEQSRETEFDRKVDELANSYGEKVKYKYVGPLPPFNFVNLLIRTGES